MKKILKLNSGTKALGYGVVVLVEQVNMLYIH